MARATSGNYNALSWVQDEVQHALADALQALTTFIDAPDNDAAIELCIAQLHQVNGTMEMLNLEGAQLLAREMLDSAILLRENADSTNNEVQDSVLKGLLVLPNYLQLLGDELHDHPLHLIATLNELRTASGSDAFETKDLFSPNLAVALPDNVIPDPSRPLPTLSIPIRKLSHAFQFSLLRWFKEDDDLSLRRMGNIARYLRLSCIQERSITLWWTAEGVIEAILDKGLPTTPEIKLMIGKLTTPIKLFTIEGEQEFIALFPSDLTQAFLLQAARSISSGNHVTSLRETFDLDFFDPQQHQKIYNFTGNALPDAHSELINQIQEIKEEISRFHDESPSTEDVYSLQAQLNSMAGTFEVLTDLTTTKLLREQAAKLAEVAETQSAPTEEHLMSLADVLLKIEYHLQSGRRIEDQQSAEQNELQQTVLTECLSEIVVIKESFASLANTSGDASAQITEISSQLELIGGSLTLLSLTDAATLLEDTSKQLGLEVADEQTISAEHLSDFAEIIASAELYMEGIKLGGSQQPQLLERAQALLNAFNSSANEKAESEIQSIEDSFEELLELPDVVAEPEIKESSVSRYIRKLEEQQYEPEILETSVARYIKALGSEPELLTAEPELDADPELIISAPSSETESEPELIMSELEPELEVEQIVTETSVARYIREQSLHSEEIVELETQSHFAEGVDPEIAEVFIEEAEDVLSQLADLLPEWQQNQDVEKTIDVRRHFHTLKGSGRMAGAETIGELSWSIENLLNQATEGSQSLSPEMITLINDCYQTLPDLVSRFSNGDLDSTEASDKLISRANTLFSVESEEDSTESDELQQIFYAEAAQHIATFNTAFESAEHPFELNKELLRAAHSLKGCANIADVQEVATVAIKLDYTLRTLYEQKNQLDAKQYALLTSTINSLENTIKSLISGQDIASDEAIMLGDLENILTSQNTEATIDSDTEKRIDPEFLAVYLDESEELLDDYLQQLEQIKHQPDNHEAQNGIKATLQTLEENAQHAELTSLAALYQVLTKLASKAGDNDQDVLSLLDHGYEEINNQIESLMHNQPAPSIENFSQQIEKALDKKKQAQKTAKAPAKEEISLQAVELTAETFAIPTEEPELLEAFTEECAELLESSGNAIKIWHQNNDDQEAVLQLQRDLHTLKGSSRLTGIIPIADLTHQTESLTFLAIDKKCEMDDRFFNLLLRAQDRLAEMQEQLANQTEFGFAHDLITEIAQFSNQPEPIQTQIAKPSNPVLNKQLNDKSDSPVHHEQIRVRADLLDFISNFAGEVNISRDRVGQQNTAIHSQLSEMDSTVSRLQEQLRKLEIETENQILFRYEDEKSSENSEFDPLELDRFSMIQQLSRSLTESVSDMNEITLSLDSLVRDTDSILLQQSRLSTDLQQGLMNTRLLPFEGLIPRFERIVRQVNAELDKKSQLFVHGAGHELDRTILDRVVAPIEHIVRNAIAHGIEQPEDRIKSGKEEAGKLIISITREGSEILITLSDDGQGIDVEKVRKKALEQELINPEHIPSDEDLIQLILTSGFSTSDDISQISGRGVGMDVVSNEIRALKGRLSIQSTPGQGTTFNIRLPLTLSIMQSLLVGCDDEQYAIPLVAVHAGDRISTQDINDLLASEDTPQYEFNGEYYDFLPLASLLKQPLVLPEDPKIQLPVLLFRYGDMHIALLIDSIDSNREIVLKTVGDQLAHIDAITGATILGDGQVVFILDIPTLVDTHNLGHEQESSTVEAVAEVDVIEDRTPIAMVVDDSITMRKASGNLLKRHGFDVITARDGIDAVAQLNEQVPDVILLDVEMPRMDGFEFATLVRNLEQYKALPIIMITSRTGDKHRDRALSIGVNAYLGKPYQEVELMETIQALLEL